MTWICVDSAGVFLIKSDSFRFYSSKKDEVWFVLKEDGCSSLEAMGISNIRADKDLMKSYLLGKIAVSNIKTTHINLNYLIKNQVQRNSIPAAPDYLFMLLFFFGVLGVKNHCLRILGDKSIAH